MANPAGIATAAGASGCGGVFREQHSYRWHAFPSQAQRRARPCATHARDDGRVLIGFEKPQGRRSPSWDCRAHLAHQRDHSLYRGQRNSVELGGMPLQLYIAQKQMAAPLTFLLVDSSRCHGTVGHLGKTRSPRRARRRPKEPQTKG